MKSEVFTLNTIYFLHALLTFVLHSNLINLIIMNTKYVYVRQAVVCEEDRGNGYSFVLLSCFKNLSVEDSSFEGSSFKDLSLTDFVDTCVSVVSSVV